MEDRTRQGENVVSTHRTAIGCAALDRVVLAVNVAPDAQGHSTRPALQEDSVETGFIGRVFRIELLDRVFLFWRYGLPAVHFSLPPGV